MFISKDIIFIHIPKTAGRSITKKLCDIKGVEYDKRGVSVGYDSLPIHSKCSEVMRLMGNDYKNAFRFSIVRNPFDRLVSFYEYGNINFHYKFKTFEDFVFYVTSNEYRPEVCDNWSVAKNPQSYYLNEGIDSIGRFEELSDYWESLGYKTELPKVNHTNHQHYTHYYNDTLIEMVAHHFKDDFEKFNYSKI